MSDDLIRRQEAINLLTKWSDGYSYIEIETEYAISEFKRLLPADAVPVVRCKSCRFSAKMKDEKGFNFRVCAHYWFHGMVVNDTDYCSQGRRDDDEVH